MNMELRVCLSLGLMVVVVPGNLLSQKMEISDAAASGSRTKGTDSALQWSPSIPLPNPDITCHHLLFAVASIEFMQNGWRMIFKPKEKEE